MKKREELNPKAHRLFVLAQVHSEICHPEVLSAVVFR
jgi:hypothetical protein